jgi:NAD(P)-dependent dehydrogenase (short-subunit alcohol dehydrogenase family)
MALEPAEKCRSSTDKTELEGVDIGSVFRLDGRVGLVTGGSRGIGRMIVEGLLSAGMERVYISARKEDELAVASKELGERCIPITADLSAVDGVTSLAAALAEREPRLDLLVNNAGAAWGNSLDTFPVSGWDKVMQLNVRAPFFLVQQLLPQLREGARVQPAKVINIASIDGIRPSPWETYSYQASKAGLIHLTRRLAAELISDGIIVNTLSPGFFASRMNQAASVAPEMVSAAIPAGRLGRAEDIAAAAVYLASRAGDYLVGTNLVVDGGIVDAKLHADFPAADGH